MNRRDILKLFGAGATIIPVVAGVAEVTAPATLIETPRVEPVELAQTADVEEAVRDMSNVSIVIDIVSGTKHFRFNAKTLLASNGLNHMVTVNNGILEVRDYRDPSAPRRPTSARLEYSNAMRDLHHAHFQTKS